MSDLLSDRQNKNLLFDFYGALLTEKQRDIFVMRIVDDCSLTEIAKEMGITPQAVVDSVKRTFAQLNKYEETLGMVNKFHNQAQTIEEIKVALNVLDKAEPAEISDHVSRIKTLLENL